MLAKVGESRLMLRKVKEGYQVEGEILITKRGVFASNLCHNVYNIDVNTYDRNLIFFCWFWLIICGL
jgi:hypothetical protein